MIQYDVDLIILFRSNRIKNKKKIDCKMRAIRKWAKSNLGIKGVLWGFGNHYDKTIKLDTFHVCFSNNESKVNEMMFYSKGVMKEFLVELKKKIKDNDL